MIAETKSPALGQEKHLPAWMPYALAAASIALAVLAGHLAGTLVVGVIAGAVFYCLAIYFTTSAVEGPRGAKDRLATTLIYGAFAVVMLPLLSLVAEVALQGTKYLSLEFFTADMVGSSNDPAAPSGGAYHAVIGTLYITGIATLISVPVGLFTSIYLVEYGRGRLAQAITTMVDVMTGIPSIVAGLFSLALFALLFGPSYISGFKGAVALSLLMIPVVVRSCEEMLRLVPNELREAAYALGVPKWKTIVKVVLRTSVAGITTGVMIAISRIIGETAPLMVTAGATQFFNINPMDGPMMSLPVYAYSEYRTSPDGVWGERAWAAALTLIVIVMAFNLIARLVAKIFSPRGLR